MDCERLLACLRNATHTTVSSGLNDSIKTHRTTGEPLIDSETYSINKVCFVLALLFSSAHVLLLAYFRRLCRLYGVCIVLELICFMIMQMLTLISCSLQRGTLWNVIFGKMADFTIMAAIATNLMSGVHVCRQLRLGATLTPLGSVKITSDNVQFCIGQINFRWRFRPLFVVLCTVIVLALPASVLLAGIRVPKHFILSEEHMEFANISCNVVPDFDHLYLFFPTIATLLFGQFVCLAVAVKMRYSERQDGFLLAHLPHLTARLWITIKLALTYCLVWTIAFTAIFYASVALWHVFTLLCSLQAIYVTVNSVFSRPVLDLIHQCHEEKSDDFKSEHSFVCVPTKSSRTAQFSSPHAARISRVTTFHKGGLFVRANNLNWIDRHSSVLLQR
ncbi:hypothetical protein FBUS_04575 [Fasciolopsis buskii]|uniref:Uncharacterized protein n=1 Tax=Fasciolopsis buskii TaxID=27845 RepID=A0A8E0RTF0_9TREM|nr:hypothetical protein FBUS_04575 [Fasciolopsis buski]